MFCHSFWIASRQKQRQNIFTQSIDNPSAEADENVFFFFICENLWNL